MRKAKDQNIQMHFKTLIDFSPIKIVRSPVSLVPVLQSSSSPSLEAWNNNLPRLQRTKNPLGLDFSLSKPFALSYFMVRVCSNGCCSQFCHHSGFVICLKFFLISNVVFLQIIDFEAWWVAINMRVSELFVKLSSSPPL